MIDRSDIVLAARRLWRAPAYALAVVVLLGLALAIAGGVSAVVFGLLYKPLPFAQADRLVSLSVAPRGEDIGLSVPILDGLSSPGSALGAAAGYVLERKQREDGSGRPVGSLEVARVQPGLLPLLGVEPALGRLIGPGDTQAPQADVAVLSWDLWQSAFGGTDEALDRQLWLDGAVYRIIGVLPRGFGFPARSTQAWLPLVFAQSERGRLEAGSFWGLRAIARLAPGHDADAARDEARVRVGAQLTALSARSVVDTGDVRVTPLRERWIGELRAPLRLLALAAGALLMLTAFNLCNLAVARALGHRRERAVREALGATDGRKARAAWIECGLLAMTGAALALILMPGVFGALRHFELLPTDTPQSIGLDAATLAWTVLLGCAIGVMLSLAMTRLRAGSIHGALAGGARQTTGRDAQRVRRVLIVGQIAVALALLVAIALLVRSAQRLSSEDIGFDRRHLVLAPAGVPARADEEDTRRARTVELLARARALSGVREVGLGSMPPFGALRRATDFIAPGDDAAASRTMMYESHVDTGYFAAIGAPLLEGRGFTAEEARNRAPVAIVDSAFVARHLGGQSAIGQRLQQRADGAGWRTLTIVGVVPEVKLRRLDEVPEYATVHLPDDAPQNAVLVLRTVASPRTLAGPLGTMLVDFGIQNGAHVVVMDEAIALTMADRTRLNRLLQMLGVFATVLAALGLHAVLTYLIDQRRGEYGIRKALGATPARIGRSVLAEGFALVGGGFLVGLPLAWTTARMLEDRLYGTGWFDPVAWTAATLWLLGLGLIACAWPARRAAGVEAGETLRHD